MCHGSLSLDHHRDTRVGNTCIHQARLKISLTPIQPRHSTRMSDLTSTTRVLIALIGRRLLGTIHNPAVLQVEVQTWKNAEAVEDDDDVPGCIERE